MLPIDKELDNGKSFNKFSYQDMINDDLLRGCRKKVDLYSIVSAKGAELKILNRLKTKDNFKILKEIADITKVEDSLKCMITG